MGRTAYAVGAACAASLVVSGIALAADAPPVATKPVVAGTPQVGATLTASATWTGSPAPAVEWTWRRCVSEGSCKAIKGATGATYVATADDLGQLLQAHITLTNSAGTDDKKSKPTAAVVAAPPVQPTPTPTPTPTRPDGGTDAGEPGTGHHQLHLPAPSRTGITCGLRQKRHSPPTVSRPAGPSTGPGGRPSVGKPEGPRQNVKPAHERSGQRHGALAARKHSRQNAVHHAVPRQAEQPALNAPLATGLRNTPRRATSKIRLADSTPTPGTARAKGYPSSG
jgi:hypothetical protein